MRKVACISSCVLFKKTFLELEDNSGNRERVEDREAIKRFITARRERFERERELRKGAFVSRER